MPADLINGLGGDAGFGEQVLPRGDDNTLLVNDISSVFEIGINFDGQVHNVIRISTNGHISFGDNFFGFTPGAISDQSGAGIFPFWSDGDTGRGPQEPTPGGNSTGSNRVYYDFDTVNDRIVITWDDVGHYGNETGRLNAYQVILTDRGLGDFDIELRYEDINWSSADGTGGPAAAMGYSSGVPGSDEFFVLPASGDEDQILALEETLGNTGEEGRWLFELRSGASAGPPTEGDDFIIGTTGNDVVDLLGGNDRFLGLDGNDLIYASAGDDVIDGGAGADTVSYAAASAGVSIFMLDPTRTVTTEHGADEFISVENLIGSSFDDLILGTAQNNLLQGNLGNDDLYGLSGDDILLGEEGDDQLDGMSGNDILRGGSGQDILIGGNGNDDLFGGIGVDRLYGFRNDDNLWGGDGDDLLRGNRGDDRLSGDAGRDSMKGHEGDDLLLGGADGDYLLGGMGSDILDGGAGSDSLTGGAGAGFLDETRDIFVFADTASGGGGFDRVKDFEDGIDVLDLTAFGFASFDEIELLAVDRATGLRIAFAPGDVAFLQGFTLAEFDVTDVIF